MTIDRKLISTNKFHLGTIQLNKYIHEMTNEQNHFGHLWMMSVPKQHQMQLKSAQPHTKTISTLFKYIQYISKISKIRLGTARPRAWAGPGRPWYLVLVLNFLYILYFLYILDIFVDTSFTTCSTSKCKLYTK